MWAKNKKTNESDNGAIICDVGTIQCDDITIKCK